MVGTLLGARPCQLTGVEQRRTVDLVRWVRLHEFRRVVCGAKGHIGRRCGGRLERNGLLWERGNVGKLTVHGEEIEVQLETIKSLVANRSNDGIEA